MPLTLALGEFVSNLRFDYLPAEARRIARTGFIDCIGVMIAGSGERAPRLLHQVLSPSPGQSTLCFGNVQVPGPDAACINATAAHALDYDDVALQGHPSAVLVPAILAEGELLDAPGTDLLVAYAAGYEVWAELLSREPDFYHMKGWHPTGVFGAVAAAAACASLRRLDPAGAAHALAIGASQSGGLMANFGSMTKPLHAGRAAHSGVIAARLAEAGFTGSADAIEHEHGFLRAFSPAGLVDHRKEPIALGKEWRLLTSGLSIKRYPTCHCTHRCIDGMLEAADRHRIDPNSVRYMGASVSKKFAGTLRNHGPTDALGAKFNMEFAMSAALVARRVGLAELSDGFVQRAEVQDLMSRVGIEANVDYDPTCPGAAVYDQIRVELVSGVVIEGEPVYRARGHSTRPLSDSELAEKFRGCLAYAHSPVEPTGYFERLMGLERLNARTLISAGTQGD